MLNQAPPRRLYRSRQQRLVAGVAGGLAEYVGTDPTLVRVILFLALLPAGPFGLVAYGGLALLIPLQPTAPTLP